MTWIRLYENHKCFFMHQHYFVLLIIAVLLQFSQTCQGIFISASFSVALLFFPLLYIHSDSLFVFLLRIDFAANTSHSCVCVCGKCHATAWCVVSGYSMPKVSEQTDILSHCLSNFQFIANGRDFLKHRKNPSP